MYAQVIQTRAINIRMISNDGGIDIECYWFIADPSIGLLFITIVMGLLRTLLFPTLS